MSVTTEHDEEPIDAFELGFKRKLASKQEAK